MTRRAHKRLTARRRAAQDPAARRRIAEIVKAKLLGQPSWRERDTIQLLEEMERIRFEAQFAAAAARYLVIIDPLCAEPPL